MSLDAMDWVWTKSKSKGVGRLVLLALADKTPTTAGECKAYGSQRWLAGQANCNQEAVTDALPVLCKLGELEIVEGEKGPYGAAMYRLPKAIGHERPTRSNRPAHPVDSQAERSKKSTGSPGHPATGSPGRFEAQSTGSPDHNTTYPPKTTTSAPTDPPATGAEGGGGGSDVEQAETFLGQLPGDWGCGRRTARKLAPMLIDRIHEQGWRLDGDLARELTKNPGGIGSFEAVLPGRIDNLRKRASAKTRDSPAASSLPRWCESEDCNPTTRYRTTDTHDGPPVSAPCRDCHPDMIKDAA